MAPSSRRWLQAIELVLVLGGVASLVQYVRLSRQADRIELANKEAATTAITAPGPESSTPAPESPGLAPEWPFIGEIDIPRLGLSAAIRYGDDANALNGAVGFLPDTALPWAKGNTVLAAHRDRLFRPLADIRQGDEIVLKTRHGAFEYRVSRTFIVNPKDVWVLNPVPEVDLTLLTCYPFFYTGHAPQRFVVRARKISSL